MESVRDYKYDNLKFILIFLVVLGHIIEPLENLNILYLIIYSFHMPVFIYISGYFSKGNKKSIIKPLILYFIFQIIYFFIYKYVLKESIKLQYTRPNWILWYLFALSIWNVFAFFIKKFTLNKTKCYIVIIVLTVISLMCGFINIIGYEFSLSRIIIFFPFFLLGFFTKNYKIRILEKENIKKTILFLLIGILCVIYFIINENIDRKWFYGSYSYIAGNYTIFFRAVFLTFSFIMIYFLVNYMTNKKSIISIIGRDTLYIYLIHGLVIKYLNKYVYKYFFKNNMTIDFLISLLLCILIITVIEVLYRCIIKIIYDNIKNKIMEVQYENIKK